MPDQVRYYDPVDEEDKIANEIEVVWKHNQLPVSELKFYLRENHPKWESTIAAREQEILEIWMKELKYDLKYFVVIDKQIKEKAKIEDQGQIDNWLKPNSERVLKPTEVEEL